jgi:hypothetical protein
LRVLRGVSDNLGDTARARARCTAGLQPSSTRHWSVSPKTHAVERHPCREGAGDRREQRLVPHAEVLGADGDDHRSTGICRTERRLAQDAPGHARLVSRDPVQGVGRWLNLFLVQRQIHHEGRQVAAPEPAGFVPASPCGMARVEYFPDERDQALLPATPWRFTRRTRGQRRGPRTPGASGPPGAAPPVGPGHPGRPSPRCAD